MAKKNLDTFHVYATVVVDTSIEIKAETLEDALNKARDLKIDNFVDILGEHNDSGFKITGVYESYKPINLK